MAIAKATTGFLAVALIGMMGVLGAAMAVPQAADPKPQRPNALISVEVEPPGENKDEHGDPLPAGAVARLGTTRWRHDRAVGFATFVPDGKSVVTVGDDMTVRV